MLNTEVSQRPDINQVLYHLENIAQTRGVQLADGALKFLKKTELLLHTPSSSIIGGQQASSAPQSNQNIPGGGQGAGGGSGGQGNNWMGSAAGLFKGNSLFKTIKDASSKVMDSVQQYEFLSFMNFICSFFAINPYTTIEVRLFGWENTFRKTWETCNQKK